MLNSATSASSTLQGEVHRLKAELDARSALVSRLEAELTSQAAAASARATELQDSFAAKVADMRRAHQEHLAVLSKQQQGAQAPAMVGGCPHMLHLLGLCCNIHSWTRPPGRHRPC